MSWEKVSDNPQVQASYEAMREEGQSHRFAEMAALRQFPGVMTDAVFMQGHCNGSQFDGQEHIGDYYRKVAEAEGQDTKGKVYKSGLAAYPGDPRAWIESRGDVKRLCEERNWECEGAVTHNVEPLPVKEVGLADTIIREEVVDRLEAEPWRKAEEVVEEVTELRTPHWAKKEPAT